MSTSSVPLPRGVLVDVLWDRTRVRDVALVIGAAGLTALAAQIAIPVPGSPVPITLQTFAVLVTAAALGATRGTLAQGLYVFAGALGLPVFAEAGGGIETVFGATGGYLLGFVVAAFVIGWLSERGADRRVVSTAVAYVLGSAIIYAFGVPVLAVVAGESLGWAVGAGLVPFLLGDVLKALAAAAMLPSAWRLAGGSVTGGQRPT